MGFAYDGPDGVVTVGGESDHFVVTEPDEAVDGDIVTWDFRGNEVIAVRVGDPPSDYDESY